MIQEFMENAHKYIKFYIKIKDQSRVNNTITKLNNCSDRVFYASKQENESLTTSTPGRSFS